ncbi:MAG TPA: DUF5320 domain-containing protein [Candidatus Nanoarchaeia archaeon]|nr:DUF5320 domain-containing protein [Candidatus Nanoarchaeia archaeon]
MPNRDGTGPINGLGKGLGPCGNGMRRGFGCRWSNISKEEEKKMLENQKEAIEKRLKEL